MYETGSVWNERSSTKREKNKTDDENYYLNDSSSSWTDVNCLRLPIYNELKKKMDRRKGEVERSLECSVSIKCLSLWIEFCKMIWIFPLHSIPALSGVGVVNKRYAFMRKILFACERNDFSGIIFLCKLSKGDIFILLACAWVKVPTHRNELCRLQWRLIFFSIFSSLMEFHRRQFYNHHKFQHMQFILFTFTFFFILPWQFFKRWIV